jgi:hypothetical protein
VPPLRLTGSGRLRGMIQAGNLHLTARDAIALALESSLDLESDRYNLVMADWAVSAPNRAARCAASPEPTRNR